MISQASLPQPLSGNKTNIDEQWMRMALELAAQAVAEGEIPVGAVLVFENQILGTGWNQPIQRCDPTAHAEILALREAAEKINNYRLLDTTLYVTLEPCAMCLGAMLQARIKRLMFGAKDPRAGAVLSVFNLLEAKELNHRIDWTGEILANESANLLRNFFKVRR